MATYKQIQEYIKQEYGITVKTCWIADVKRQYGKTSRLATNRIDPEKAKYPCPQGKRSIIEEAMKHFGAL